MRFAFGPVSRVAAPAVFLPVLALMLATPLCHAAASGDEIIPDSAALAQLEARAAQANPREQCFLYTELVHSMTEIAGKQMLDGDTEHASATLKRVEYYANLIHLGLAKDTKRLKNAEMIMHHTTYRLSGYLHVASDEDRATLQATLKRLDNVQNELLDQVFNH
jgi:hypothetical protein